MSLKEQFKSEIYSIKKDLMEDLAIAEGGDVKTIKSIRNKYLSRKGVIPSLCRKIPLLPLDYRSEIGSALNEIRNQAEHLLKHLELRYCKAENGCVYPDISMPPFGIAQGSLHPLTLVLNKIEKFFISKGFTIEENTLELESTFHNFDSLNIPLDHPSRDPKDTFYISQHQVLRTHTSSAQYRMLQTKKAPFKIMVPGNVYRRDSDLTHTPMFTQMEGMIVAPQVNLIYLLELLTSFIKYFFGQEVKMRWRSAYFPFTSPSAEVDIYHRGYWIEILGGGIVHPKVMSHMPKHNLQANCRGLAFGIGIERLAMLKYNIDSLKLLYQNDLRFLEQFASLARDEI